MLELAGMHNPAKMKQVYIGSEIEMIDGDTHYFTHTHTTRLSLLVCRAHTRISQGPAKIPNKVNAIVITYTHLLYK
jgi:hypothetical protein